MKQLTIQDHIKQTRASQMFPGVQEVKNAFISNFKTMGKGLFLQSGDNNLETGGLTPDEGTSARGKVYSQKSNPLYG